MALIHLSWARWIKNRVSVYSLRDLYTIALCACMHWVRSKWWEQFFVCFSVCVYDVSSKVAGLLSWTPLLTHMSYLNRYWFVFAVEWLQKYIIDPFLLFSLKWTSQHGSKFESGKKSSHEKIKQVATNVSNLTYLKKPILETPQDFCKTWANLVDILIFYLYHVIVRSSKIISYLSRPAQQMIAQILFSKSFFSEFFLNLFCLKNIRNRAGRLAEQDTNFY